MEPQIIPRGERTALAEPEVRLSLSELQTLLREAAAYERAANPAPVVLHAHPSGNFAEGSPVTLAGRFAASVQPSPHPGVNVAIPAAPVTVTTVKHSERSIWPLLWTASACTGIGSCLVTAVTGSLIPLAVTLAALAVWGVATYRLVFIREL